ncbi:hypothetical protein [Streptomyces sp. NRRL F-5630]|uniref:hypothetical protein n=1 Tax=Streptomyces sp. NRRL F-5630 TaxID=1463864 RepID=UPI0004C71FA3|nr:hypothetical protein [Streptomyces sp. NRRL F-5630]
MSMADLVAAGAPELPEGYFYRVRQTLHVGYKVEIREQRRFMSRLVADTFVFEERHSNMESAVVKACRYAAATMRERALRESKAATLRALAGDHDPKGGR